MYIFSKVLYFLLVALLVHRSTCNITNIKFMKNLLHVWKFKKNTETISKIRFNSNAVSKNAMSLVNISTGKYKMKYDHESA